LAVGSWKGLSLGHGLWIKVQCSEDVNVRVLHLVYWES